MLFLPGRRTQRFHSKPCKVRFLHREWVKNNPERAKEIDTASRARYSPDQQAERLAKVREWRVKNQERERPKERARHMTRRDEVNPKRQQWYRDHKEHSLAQTKRIYRHARLNTPWELLLRSAKGRAAAKKVPFELTNEWAELAWTGRCAISGLEFDLGNGNHWSRMKSPSIDRIKPEIGYTPDNCRFILWAINAFKGTGTDEEMFEVVDAMVMAL
jgi:hypothetical protein